MESQRIAVVQSFTVGLAGVRGGLDEDGAVIVADTAHALSLRLTAQEHWEQAASVRDGLQPRIDPDYGDLEQLDEGVRSYRLHECEGTMDGLPALVSRRLVKRLVAGAWETEVVVDSYKRSGGPQIALS